MANSSPNHCALCGTANGCVIHNSKPGYTWRVLLWNDTMAEWLHGSCMADMLTVAGEYEGIDYSPILSRAAGANLPAGDYWMEDGDWQIRGRRGHYGVGGRFNE